MNRLHKIFFTLLALASLMFCAQGNARAASDGVVDDAHIFSQDAISRADQMARQIEDMHKRQVLVQTFSAIPDDLQSKLQADGKERFFAGWSQQLSQEKHLNGILILICMNPGHVEVTVGNETARTFQGRDAVSQILVSAFKAKQYDRGLVDAMQYIDDHMSRPRANNGTPPAGGNYQGGGTTAPPPVSGPSNTSTHGFSFHLGGCVCAAIALVIILMLVASLARRRGGYTGGYGPGGYGGAGYPPGAYPPGGYPQSGGGFGRGLLGGLLGGALGSWGYDRMRGNQGGQMGVPPPMGNPPDANLPPDTSYSSSGGDFGSSPDPGGSSGGDFGGSSGGDFGGSSGGDFGGGGGGDMGGGGGDAGGSSGGDF